MTSSEPTPWPTNIWLAVAGLNGAKNALGYGHASWKVPGGAGGLGSSVFVHQRTVALRAIPAPSMLSRVQRLL
jgi:hypothetical protein